jgi:hypothetical protein
LNQKTPPGVSVHATSDHGFGFRHLSGPTTPMRLSIQSAASSGHCDSRGAAAGAAFGF